MTEKEWLEFGYEKKIIDEVDYVNCEIFERCYIEYFRSLSMRVKPQTLDRIEVCYNKYFISSDFVGKYMIDLTENEIALFLNKCILDYNLSRKEYYRIYQIVKGVYDYVSDTRITLFNAISFDTVKRYVNHTFAENMNFSRIVSDWEYNSLYRAVVDSRIYVFKQSQCLLLLLNFYLGLRIGELAGLKFSDFDIVNRVVHVQRTYTKSYDRLENARTGAIRYYIDDCCKTTAGVRDVPLCDCAVELYNEIVKWHRARGYHSEYLCYDGKDVIKPRSLAGCLTRLCRLCGIAHIRSHDIRKTLATRLHDENMPTRMISDILGHTEMSTTEKYYIKSKKDYAEMIKYLNIVMKN